MTKSNSTVVDLLAEDSSAQLQTVAQRIERRLEVLRAWLSDGIPLGKSIPRSLNAARVWEDDDFGIQQIRSPNDFTTTHAEHGRAVKQIGQLLTALTRRYGRPTGPAATTTARKFDRADYDRALEKAVSQWHTERDQRLAEQRRADDAKSLTVALLDENAEKDRLIANLQRQLKAKSGLRAVE